MNIGVEVLSIFLQITAMILAMRLIRLSGSSLAWICITMGIAGMAGRRIWSLYETLIAGRRGDMLFDALGLATSVCMVAGVALIGPIFTSLNKFQSEQGRLITELREAMANIQTLKGYLPICASCKKIRDDRGYWNQIETYIRDHSEAEFSHGICPDCAKKLYPEYFGSDDAGRKPAKSPADAG